VNELSLEIYRSNGHLQNPFEYGERSGALRCFNRHDAKGIKSQTIHPIEKND